MKQVLKYSKQTVWVHWVSALLIFAIIGTGITMEKTAISPEKLNLYKIHFGLGFIVFILTIYRSIILFKNQQPISLYPENSKHQKLINFVHKGFYIVIIWMCVSGIASLFLENITPALSQGDYQLLPKFTGDNLHPILISHHIVAKIMFLLLALHIGGFIMHLITKKENTINRIWFR